MVTIIVTDSTVPVPISFTERFLLSLSCDKREHGDLHEEDDGGNGDSEEGDGGNGDLHEEGDRGTAISTANLRYFFSSSEEPPIPDPNPNPLQLALTFAKIGVSVEDLASLPPVADAGSEKKAERLALRVGENLFNFMQSFCGIDGSRLVVPMDILDRWFKKFQERARKDPSYLKDQKPSQSQKHLATETTKMNHCLIMVFLLLVASSAPSHGRRLVPLDVVGEAGALVFELKKVSAPGSGPSGCTNTPNNPGGPCPPTPPS
ncbi:hypothetical protein ZIOFF_004108 [Zingiber officinale]|uniref:Hikeshi-like C-terminal domain-containing protein n=1 Tax=Zingiber officinale TaxID=94328 RepID=A0A8J5I7J8_ZINOF|nr:hypothetical protein ZIOFF_004108 [Zingiber officinale]